MTILCSNIEYIYIVYNIKTQSLDAQLCHVVFSAVSKAHGIENL